MRLRANAGEVLGGMKLMAITRAPIVIWVAFCKGLFARKRRKSYKREQLQFARENSGRKLTKDWFSENIPRWRDIFEQSNVDLSGRYEILEIGSFEGLSSSFLLETFPNSRLTCIDTWQGADEHAQIDMREVEARFDSNTAAFKSRLVKVKGTSYSFFAGTDVRKEMFDIVYLDGSHFSDDVLIDALRCFSMLKRGGILIFDDYWWGGYTEVSGGPTIAINAFVRLKKSSLMVIDVLSQLAVVKQGSVSHEIVR